MTLRIDLRPELEDRLREEAAKRGMNADEYALRLIEQNLPAGRPAGTSLWNTLTPEEWARRTRAWAESHRDWPVLPAGADDRASFYEGRD